MAQFGSSAQLQLRPNFERSRNQGKCTQTSSPHILFKLLIQADLVDLMLGQKIDAIWWLPYLCQNHWQIVR